jgi:formylglycine-generating enzyme required for sulfatase activity
MARDRYTRYPRPILWLIPGGVLPLQESVEVEPFYLSKFPVSNEQFEAFDPGFVRSGAAPADRDPALGLSWQEAEAYCRWYAEVARKPMRLPTEVEWEYACRAGSEAACFWGEDAAQADLFQWDAENSPETLPPLDQKKANEFGLFGMLGGVWEWVAAAGEAPGHQVLRGGSYRTPRQQISCSLRRQSPVTSRVEDGGFRIAKSLR